MSDIKIVKLVVMHNCFTQSLCQHELHAIADVLESTQICLSSDLLV